MALRPALAEESFYAHDLELALSDQIAPSIKFRGDVGLGASNKYSPWRSVNAPVQGIPLEVARTTIIVGIVTVLCRLVRAVSPNPTSTLFSGHPYEPLDTDLYGSRYEFTFGVNARRRP